jgi:hypothetical protein
VAIAARFNSGSGEIHAWPRRRPGEARSPQCARNLDDDRRRPGEAARMPRGELSRGAARRIEADTSMLRAETLTGAILAMLLRRPTGDVRMPSLPLADDRSPIGTHGQGGAHRRAPQEGLQDEPIDGERRDGEPPFSQTLDPSPLKPHATHGATRHLVRRRVNMSGAATFRRRYGNKASRGTLRH